MRLRHRFPATVAVAALLASCSSTHNGVVSLEARGAASIEALEPLAYVVFAGGASGTTSNATGGNNGGEIDGVGYGLEAAVNTTFIDVIGGIQQRELQDEWVTELSIGLRKRLGPDESPVYLFGLLRSDQDHTDGSETFNGFALGLGVLAQLNRHWFVDMNVAWEQTNHLDIDPEDSSMNEGVLQIGVGWAF